MTYSPREMTRATRVLQRKFEQKNVVMLGGKNPAVIWQCGNGVVSETSRGWCLLSRMRKNEQLNIDCWVSALLGLSQLLKEKPRMEVMVL